MIFRSLVFLCMPVFVLCACSEKEEGASIKGSIAFRSTLDHVWGEIYTVDSKAAELRRLSAFEGKYPRESFMNSFEKDDKPKVSPDGKKVAFLSGADTRLKIADMASGELKDLGSAKYMAWSADGKKLAYIPNDLSGQIHICNQDGSQDRRLTNFNLDNSYFFHHLYWEKTGNIVASANMQMGVGKLVRIQAENGQITDTSDPIQLGQDLFHHIGQNLTCWVANDKVYVMEFNGAKDSRFYFFPAQGAMSASISPDGKRIAYTYDANVSGKLSTNIATINVSNGRDKFLVTENAEIGLAVRYQMDFIPVWYDNKTLFLGAGDVLLITDDMNPEKEIFINAAGAYGQISYMP